MRVIIVGGGIGGLSAAIALRRHGHEPVVLERATRLEAVGAGIALFANAMHALARLGVADVIRSAGSPVRHSAILTSAGRELTSFPPDLLQGAVAVHRADLQQQLATAAGVVQLGTEVITIDQTAAGVWVRTADGNEIQGDLLIGADGLRSLVRPSVADATLRYAGYTAWRGISPVALEQGRLTESWGAGERFGLVDIGSRTYWFATANLPHGAADDPYRRKSELMQRFSCWHSPIEAVLEATPEDAILRNDVHFLEPLARWSEGRIVLLGDAAHATTPGIGQGAAMAIEDATALADALSAGAALPASLVRYAAIRRPRTELVLKLSRRVDRTAQLSGALSTRLRNLLVSRTPSRLQARDLEPVIHHPS